jgi:hypothetical protein
MSQRPFRRDPSPRGERSPRSARVAAKQGWLLLHGLALAVGLWSAFRPTLASGFARLQADPGDTLLNHYVLEHSWRWLTQPDYAGTLWSPPFFHPAPGVLAYSENLLGTAPLYWLLRPACPDVLAYQLWMLLAAALTYASLAWVLRRLGVGHLLCALGGYLFAFGLPRLAQLGHQQLLPHLFAPLAVYAAWRFLQRPTASTLAGVLALSYGQVLTSIYLGWFLLFSLGLFAAVVALLDRSTLGRVGGFLRRRWPVVLALLGVWAGGMAWLFAPYREVNHDFRRLYGEVRDLLPRPESWLATGPTSAWSDWLPPEWRPRTPELWLFPGVTFVGVAGLACGVVLGRRSPLTPPERVLAAAGLLTAALLVLVSLRWGNWSPWHAVYRLVPGATAIRAVGRVVFTAELLALLGGLIALDRLLRAAGRWGTVAAALMLLAGMAESQPWRQELPSFPVGPWEARVERLRQRLTPGTAAYIALPPDVPYWEGQLAAMWAGLKANVPVVNGYSGRYPPGYPDWTRTMTRQEFDEWRARITGRPVRFVNDPVSPLGER